MQQIEKLFDAGGSMGALMRQHDWSRSPLGAPGGWPQSLRTVVAVLLQSQFPMFVAWGSELGFLYNDSYAEILGAKHPAALGRRFRDIWSEIWADISPLIDAAMAGQSTYREDLPLLMNRRGYEEQTWFTFSYSPVRDETGKVAGMFCACTETTGRVLAERALRELNETLEHRVVDAVAERNLLARIVEGSDAFVQVVDVDYRWLAMNKAAADEFERLFGLRPQVGQSMLELLESQPKHRDAVKAVWSRALSGEVFTETAEFGDPTGYRRAYEMRYNTLRDRDGRRIGAYQFVYDVTERLRDQQRLRQAEDALRHAQKLESLGQLTSGVAHDFNNLLAIFANGLEVLKRNPSADQCQIIFDGMSRAVARGSDLTRHLLAFSRRRPLKPESIDLAAHLSAMREMLTRSLGGNIHVVMSFASSLWPVEVDLGEFESAIVNLCVNARDAMRAGGTISIDAENDSNADAANPLQFVKLSVCDTGCGMPQEVIDRVFEPFFTTKDVGKGSGLGLPQVYGFVQQSGGRIDVQSQVGVGTTVVLRLPRAHAEPAGPHLGQTTRKLDVEKAEVGRPREVLLVEDDGEVAAMTREMLRCVGFSVIHATHPDAALGCLANGRRIDVVLSDIMMPGGVSGLDLAREIRRRQPELPIVLVTGLSEAAAGIEDGQFDLLLKPYTVESLAAALNRRIAER